MRIVPRLALSSALLCAGIAIPASAQPVIQTIAGTDLVFQGNGKPAPGVSLGRVARVTVDPNGRPVFADPNYHLVFRVEADGSIRVIAGNNVQGLAGAKSSLGLDSSGGGYSGDNGPATSAALNRPQGVAYDAAGNLYIADTFNQRIRMVNPQGIISTIAGNGQTGFQGDGGPALAASLNLPTNIAVDSAGNLYVSDSQNFRIRKINPQGIITTIAGTGTYGVVGDNVTATSSPIADIEALAVDSQGNLYLAEFTPNRVRRISGGLVTTVAGNGNGDFSGDGPALIVSLNRPSGLAFDSGGNLLIADAGNMRIRKLAGGVLTTIAGTGQEGFAGDGGSALKAALHIPFGIAVAGSGDIYFADRDNFRIRRIDAQGSISTVAGNGRLISSQDGGPSSLANFLDPFGVSFDTHGAMLVADTDNNIIRRLNSDGTFSTIAGTGAQESNGDNGPATQAGLLGPFSVTSDSSGNLYEPEADASPGLVRKIGLSGLISTVAGDTNQPLSVPIQTAMDSSGNLYIADLNNSHIVRRAPDGSFTQLPTAFSNPGGIAIDSLGNLYVTEWGAGRVQRISPTGAATVIAGGGNIAGAAADGGPATFARLGRPAGVVVDGAGNVYFTDFTNGSVRKVAVNGTISTIAGNGTQAFSGDGGPATGASLNGPWGLTLDSSGALYVADVLNNRIRKILLNSAPAFALSTQSVSLTAASNGAVSSPSTVTPNSSLTGLLFTTSTDQPWLQVQPGSGAMPAAVQVTADPTGLAAGTYSGNVTFTAPGANPPTRSAAVTFTVTPELPPNLKADTQGVGLSFVAGADPAGRQITLRNAGSGSVSFSASASLVTGSGWLAVSPAAGSVNPNTPQALTATVTPGQLAPGTYTGSIAIANSATSDTIVIPVSVAIAAPASKLVLSQPGLTFRAVAGGGASLPRTFGILNSGQGPMNWTAAAATLSGGSWLSVSPTSGVVTTRLIDTSQVKVSVDPSGLGAGTYYGRVDVNAPGNAVQTVTIELDVLAAGSSPLPDVYPSGLIFTGTQGSNPSSQTISISNLTAQPLTYTSSRSTQTGAAWFVHVPASGVIAPNQPANIVVQPDFTNLSPGVSQGSLTLLFSDGTTRVVSILGVVASGLTGTFSPTNSRQLAVGCSASSLSIQPVSLPAAFSAALSQSTTLEVLLADNCGNPVTPQRAIANGLKVLAYFSNGDRNATFSHIGDGHWNATWLPLNGSPGSSVTITITVFLSPAGGGLLYNQLDLHASLTAAGTAPVLTPGAIVNGASFQGNVPVAPGTIISIFGSNLSDGVAIADGTPLPKSLKGTQVALGGQPVPLRYTSDGQLNALVPYEVPVNTQLQVLVQHGSDLSVGDMLTVAAAQPAIFTQNQAGTGQGAIVNGVTNVLADPSAPVGAGDVITIYCTGLGTVDPPVPSGEAAPLSPLSRTTNPVTAMIGGIGSEVTFAGLAPGFAGLYQVNAVVPQGITPGDEVPVLLMVAGQTSRPVTIAVH